MSRNNLCHISIFTLKSKKCVISSFIEHQTSQGSIPRTVHSKPLS